MLWGALDPAEGGWVLGEALDLLRGAGYCGGLQTLLRGAGCYEGARTLQMGAGCSVGGLVPLMPHGRGGGAEVPHCQCPHPASSRLQRGPCGQSFPLGASDSAPGSMWQEVGMVTHRWLCALLLELG